MRLTIVAGARPNFMKIAPIIHAIKKHPRHAEGKLSYRLVHTGQHYDAKLSESFFNDLGIPAPDANLEVGSASHAVQTANIMIGFEQELLNHPTDMVLVVGDVNSTMAATLVAKKMGIKITHVEAGLRSFDLEMPEEINRMVTDVLADVFFTTNRGAAANLRALGARDSQIHFVGNVMIDTLNANLSRLQRPDFFSTQGLKEGEYLTLTLHRPSNVDDPEKLADMISFIGRLAGDKKLVFPVHPRTRQKLAAIGPLPSNLILAEPMPYLEFIYLVKNGLAVVTDSGGIQEETTFLKVPCLTLRENTERPETVEVGSNLLLGFDKPKIAQAFQLLLSGNWKRSEIPELWDGRAAERIIDTLVSLA